MRGFFGDPGRFARQLLERTRRAQPRQALHVGVDALGPFQAVRERLAKLSQTLDRFAGVGRRHAEQFRIGQRRSGRFADALQAPALPGVPQQPDHRRLARLRGRVERARQHLQAPPHRIHIRVPQDGEALLSEQSPRRFGRPLQFVHLIAQAHHRGDLTAGPRRIAPHPVRAPHQPGVSRRVVRARRFRQRRRQMLRDAA